MGEAGTEPSDPLPVIPDALRVELVDAEDVVESSGSSTTFQVWRVASGANDTLRLAVRSISAFSRVNMR